MYEGFALLDHSLLVPYIIVYIFAQFRPYLLSFAHICSVSLCQTSLEKECSRGYKTVLCLGAVTTQVPENKVTTMYAVSTGTLPEFLAWVYEKKRV